MQFRVEASVGNREGEFDAAYEFGDGKAEAEMLGTPEQIGAAVARYLAAMRPEDCRAMQYGTGEFFVRLTIRPEAANDDPESASEAR